MKQLPLSALTVACALVLTACGSDGVSATKSPTPVINNNTAQAQAELVKAQAAQKNAQTAKTAADGVATSALAQAQLELAKAELTKAQTALAQIEKLAKDSETAKTAKTAVDDIQQAIVAIENKVNELKQKETAQATANAEKEKQAKLDGLLKTATDAQTNANNAQTSAQAQAELAKAQTALAEAKKLDPNSTQATKAQEAVTAIENKISELIKAEQPAPQPQPTDNTAQLNEQLEVAKDARDMVFDLTASSDVQEQLDIAKSALEKAQAIDPNSQQVDDIKAHILAIELKLGELKRAEDEKNEQDNLKAEFLNRYLSEAQTAKNTATTAKTAREAEAQLLLANQALSGAKVADPNSQQVKDIEALIAQIQSKINELKQAETDQVANAEKEKQAKLDGLLKTATDAQANANNAQTSAQAQAELAKAQTALAEAKKLDPNSTQATKAQEAVTAIENKINELKAKENAPAPVPSPTVVEIPRVDLTNTFTLDHTNGEMMDNNSLNGAILTVDYNDKTAVATRPNNDVGTINTVRISGHELNLSRAIQPETMSTIVEIQSSDISNANEAVSGYFGSATANSWMGEKELKKLRWGVVKIGTQVNAFVQGEPIGPYSVLEDSAIFTNGNAAYTRDGDKIYQSNILRAEYNNANKKLMVSIQPDAEDPNSDKFVFGGIVKGNTFSGTVNGIQAKGGFYHGYGVSSQNVAGVFQGFENVNKGLVGAFATYGGGQNVYSEDELTIDSTSLTE